VRLAHGRKPVSPHAARRFVRRNYSRPNCLTVSSFNKSSTKEQLGSTPPTQPRCPVSPLHVPASEPRQSSRLHSHSRISISGTFRSLSVPNTNCDNPSSFRHRQRFSRQHRDYSDFRYNVPPKKIKSKSLHHTNSHQTIPDLNALSL
jgi:hypothetical protein